MADDDALLLMTSDIVQHYLRANGLEAHKVPALIATVHTALRTAQNSDDVQAEPQAPRPTPAQTRKSIQPDTLTSFLDGRPYKTLKRHLRAHGLTPDEYRVQFGLASNYPMVAPSYSEKRSAMAKQIGFGAGGRGPSKVPKRPR